MTDTNSKAQVTDAARKLIAAIEAEPTSAWGVAAARWDWERKTLKPALDDLRHALAAQEKPEPGVADWWIVETDMGKVIFHGPDKSRADRVAAIHNRTAKPLYAAPPQPCADEMFRQMVLIKSLADNTNERNWADKRLYIMQAADRALSKEGSGA